MNTGTKCCIHYKDGLPYCVECEKESDQRREELHAKLAGAEIALEQARTDADHWKSECNALQRMAHEARAEIKLKNEELDMFWAEQQAMGEIIECKNKLIEQMREALENIRDYPGHIDYTAGEAHSMQEIAIDALAAERGEMS